MVGLGSIRLCSRWLLIVLAMLIAGLPVVDKSTARLNMPAMLECEDSTDCESLELELELAKSLAVCDAPQWPAPPMIAFRIADSRASTWSAYHRAHRERGPPCR